MAGGRSTNEGVRRGHCVTRAFESCAYSQRPPTPRAARHSAFERRLVLDSLRQRVAFFPSVCRYQRSKTEPASPGLLERPCQSPAVQLPAMQVMDLGCGPAAIFAIAAARAGASLVSEPSVKPCRVGYGATAIAQVYAIEGDAHMAQCARNALLLAQRDATNPIAAGVVKVSDASAHGRMAPALSLRTCDRLGPPRCSFADRAKVQYRVIVRRRSGRCAHKVPTD